MEILIDSKEPTFFSENLEGNIIGLSEGDFWVECVNGTTVVVERKTWDDAYNAWQQKRLEEQISRMRVKHLNCVLLIEGNKNGSRLFRQKQFNQLNALQKFLNRMSLEVIPVVYTSSKKDTCSYLSYLGERVERGDYQTLIRKTTILKSSRNTYHNIMSLIPGITIDRSKALYDLFDNLPDFINNTIKAERLDADNKRWLTNVRKIKEFIQEPWGNTPEEREIIYETKTEV